MKAPEDETLEYYTQNAALYAKESALSVEKPALDEFARQLRPLGKIGGISLAQGKPKVLDAGCGAGYHLAYLQNLGFDCEGFDGSAGLVKTAQSHSPASKIWKADFRILTLQKENYDGIWANQVFHHLPPQGCLRVMQTFFTAMKPNGILFASFEAELESLEYTEHRLEEDTNPVRHAYHYPPLEFESLIRQSGFQPYVTGKDLNNPRRMAVFARRV